MLAKHLIGKVCRKLNKPEVGLSSESAIFLMNQEWPGNVRQLENTLERIINLLDCPEITPHDLAVWSDMSNANHQAIRPLQGENVMQFEIPSVDAGLGLKDIVAQVEKENYYESFGKISIISLSGTSPGSVKYNSVKQDKELWALETNRRK